MGRCRLIALAYAIGVASSLFAKQEGLIELHEGDSIVALKSKWRFQAGDDLRFKNPEYDDSDWRLIRIDKHWHLQGSKGTRIGWYRLGVSINKARDLALYVPGLFFASEIYFNGKLIGSSGSIDESGKAYKLSGQPSIYSIHKTLIATESPNIVAIRIAGYGGIGGLNSLTLQLEILLQFIENSARIFLNSRFMLEHF
jgi:hypothetical protein